MYISIAMGIHDFVRFCIRGHCVFCIDWCTLFECREGEMSTNIEFSDSTQTWSVNQSLQWARWWQQRPQLSWRLTQPVANRPGVPRAWCCPSGPFAPVEWLLWKIIMHQSYMKIEKKYSAVLWDMQRMNAVLLLIMQSNNKKWSASIPSWLKRIHEQSVWMNFWKSLISDQIW